MPRAFSTDLRSRAVWLYLEHDLDVAEISQCLSVSQSSVYRYVELFQQTDDVKPRNYRRGPPKLLRDLEQLVLLRPILTLAFTLVKFKRGLFQNLESLSTYQPCACAEHSN